MWFSEHFFAPKLAVLFVTPIVCATVEQMWSKKCLKNHIPFNFSQSGSRKNNRKAFEGDSMEPTNSQGAARKLRWLNLVAWIFFTFFGADEKLLHPLFYVLFRLKHCNPDSFFHSITKIQNSIVVSSRLAVNPQLQDLISRMLAKDPKQRVTVSAIKVSFNQRTC